MDWQAPGAATEGRPKDTHQHCGIRVGSHPVRTFDVCSNRRLEQLAILTPSDSALRHPENEEG